MKDIIDTAQRIEHRVIFTHVADVELDLVALQSDPHVFLLLFIATENANLPQVRLQKALQHGIAERTGTTGDQ